MTPMRRQVSSGSPYEGQLGFSRAVRVGQVVAVSGTAAVGGPTDIEGQSRHCLETIREALHGAGASLDDVIRTRVLLVDIDHWKVVGQVHGEFFGSVRPAMTVMQVSRFIDPAWLVEIEADAVLATSD
jgi:enamine deaminase RidA (YjgF/YER057c/UK114 family)